MYIYCDGAKVSIPGRESILCTCDVRTVWHLIPRKISPC